MPDQLAEAVERGLSLLGHLEVLDPDSVPRACLDARSLLFFRSRHRLRLEEWSRALEGAEPSAGLLALQGRLDWLLGRGARAARKFRAALELQPDCPEALAYWGVSAIKTDPRLAADLLRKAARAAPARRWPRVWLAAARMRSRSPAQLRAALRDLKRAETGRPKDDFLVLFLRTLACLRLSRYREAARESGKLIAASASGSAGFGARAVARLALGDWAGAFSDDHEARERDPDCGFDIAATFLQERAGAPGRAFLAGSRDDVGAHPLMACFFAVRAERKRSPAHSRFDSALEDYRRAEALEPDSAWIQAHMARAEGPRAGLRAGLRRLNRAAALRPGAGWIYAWRGEVKRLLGRDAEALADIERCLARMPWYGYAYAWKGAVLTGRGRWAEGSRALTQALDLAPTEPAASLAYHHRSLCRRALGDALGALEDASAAFQRNEKYEWAEDGARGDAVEELSGLLARNPRRAWIFAWRGRLLMKRGDFGAAVEDFTRALALRPSTARFCVWRGTALKETGRPARARADFARALRLTRGRGLPALLLAEMKLDQGRGGEALALLGGNGEARTDVSFFRSKALLLLRLGRGREALENLKRAASLHARSAGDFETAARLLAEDPGSRAACARAVAALLDREAAARP